ncbi:alpha/beta hydrolase [Pelagibacterium lentulum]|nr:alpha/beta hydrolase [Pelagibacterium lentulum]
MLKSFSTFCIFLSIAIPPLSPVHADDFVDDSCTVLFGNLNSRFVHCEGAQRDFRTVIVAIHGWNGSCRETFGKGEGSLYSVLDDRRFYDWDCYQYDSHAWQIQQSGAGLAKRMSELKKMGYEHAMFITHSAGGIVALEYLTHRLFSYDHSGYARRTDDPVTQMREEPIVFRSIMWVSPINGLEWYASLLADFGSGLSFLPPNQQTLPDLAQDSRYLQQLRTRLNEYADWRDGLAASDRRRADMRLLFLQSMFDGVVRYLDPSKDAWLWDYPFAEVQDVRIVHTDMAMGKPDLLHIGAYLNDYVAVLEAPLVIRMDEVFGNASPTDRSADRQAAVISGVSYFADRNFDRAIIPAVELMVFMLTEDFARGRTVDLQMVELLLDLFAQELSDPEMALKAYGPLINAINAYDYSRTGARDAARSPDFVAKIQELIDLILRSAPEQHRPQIEANALSASLRIANTTLNSDLRDNALQMLAQHTSLVSTDSLVGSGVLGGLVQDFYAKQANLLPASTKNALADILQSAMERGDAATLQAIDLIGSEVNFRGQMQPLWRSLQSEEFTDYLNDFRNREFVFEFDVPDQTEDHLTRLDFEMLMGVGFDGRSTDIATDALRRLQTNTTADGLSGVLLEAQPITTLTDLTAHPGLFKETRQTLGVMYGPVFESLYFDN